LRFEKEEPENFADERAASGLIGNFELPEDCGFDG
jgi:hypothetical protein